MSRLIGVKEVMETLSISKPMAYKLIREINEELKENGYLTIQAKVNEDYLLKRFNLNTNN